MLGRRMSYFDRARRMVGQAQIQNVDNAIRAKFDRAVATWCVHKGGQSAWQQRADNMYVRDFIALTDGQKLQLIDDIWNEIILLKVGNTKVQDMVDPAPRAFKSLQNTDNGFKLHGFGFRCDTRAPNDVTAHGFLPAYRFNPPADIQGTLLHRAATANGMARSLAMWRDNRDAISEMTVCVSRTLRGCTKFPSPDVVGTAYIYAFRFALDKRGFDTENWQATEVGGLWLPGEKAFYDIAAGEICAHVQVQKSLAANDNELHRFQLASDKWTYIGNPSWATRAILGPELAHHYKGGAVQAVRRADDFAMGE